MTGFTGSAELDALSDEYIARLRAQLDEAMEVARRKQYEAMQASEYVHKMEIALQSVEALRSVGELLGKVHDPDASKVPADFVLETAQRKVYVDAKTFVALPPPRLAPYVSAAGGKRLKSKLMIFDLFKTIDQPVTRDQLRQRFFDHYGREDLQDYWQRPDNALNTAIDRAAADHYIEAVEVDGRETLYTIGRKDTETGAPAFQKEEDD